MVDDEAKVGLTKVYSLFREEERGGGGGGVQQKQEELVGGPRHLIYLKKRGVLLFLITVKDGSFP